MSTDGSGEQPLTRAQLRALRATEEQGETQDAATDAVPVSVSDAAPESAQDAVPEAAPDAVSATAQEAAPADSTEPAERGTAVPRSALHEAADAARAATEAAAAAEARPAAPARPVVTQQPSFDDAFAALDASTGSATRETATQSAEAGDASTGSATQETATESAPVGDASTGSATQQPGSATQQPGSVTQQPGSATQHDSAATQHTVSAPPATEVPEPVEGSGPTEAADAVEGRDPAASPLPRLPETPTSTRRFRLALFATLAVLALVVAGLGVVSLVQGPRLSGVEVNEAQAIDTSGSRVILTANQSLAAIDPAQVTVEPAVPFTVDAAGRNVGIRFTVPLDDSTTYTVKVAGVASSGGGPSSDLVTTFRTPSSSIFLLQRSVSGDDQIFVSDLSGQNGVPVFAHPRISDFRATPELLIVAVEEDDGSHLLVMRRDGTGERELELPGDGYISSVQVSDRGGLVGYSYSDRELTDTTGRASVLVTQPLSGDAEPRIVQISGDDASVADWQFVPDSSSLLFIDFQGGLSVEDPTGDAGVRSMGLAASILGINRGTYTAVVQRTDASFVELDLTNGEEQTLETSEPDYGPATTIVPIPDGTLRHVVQREASGLPTGQAVILVDETGTATPIAEVSGTDAILQICASPSGQYAAVTIAPDLPSNNYDDLLLPLPETLHTQLIDLSDRSVLVTLQGFDVSWCRLAPRP